MEHKSPELFHCTLSYVRSGARPRWSHFLSSKAHFSCATKVDRGRLCAKVSFSFVSPHDSEWSCGFSVTGAALESVESDYLKMDNRTLISYDQQEFCQQEAKKEVEGESLEEN